MRISALALALVGCGRLHFGLLGDDTDGGPGSDAASRNDGPAGDGVPSIDAPAEPWTLVQTGQNIGATLQLAPTGANDLIVVAIESSPVMTVTDDAPAGSNIYTQVPGSIADDTGSATHLEIWYAISVHGGAAGVFVTSTTPIAIVGWEVATTQLATLDLGGALSDQLSSANPIGPAITTSTANEFVVSVVATPVMVQTVALPFTKDSGENSQGWAHVADAHAAAGAYQALWSSQGSTYCSTTAAFVVSP